MPKRSKRKSKGSIRNNLQAKIYKDARRNDESDRAKSPNQEVPQCAIEEVKPEHQKRAANESEKTTETKKPPATVGTKMIWSNFRQAPLHEQVTSGATVVIAFATVIYMAVSVAQWTQTKHSIKVAMDAVELNRQQLRPFVFVSEVRIGGGGEASPHAIVADLKNSGQSQARRTRIEKFGLIKIAPAPPVMVEPPEAGLINNLPTQPVGLITPNATAETITVIPEDVVTDMRANKITVLIFGDIRYCDIFNASHVTRFCQRFAGRKITTETGHEDFMFGPCRGHNCDDADCPDYNPKNSECETPPMTPHP
jgi:hypothetical protein